MFKIGDEVDGVPDGKTSIRFSPAYLQYVEEKDHFGLYRKIVTVKNEGGQITKTESAEGILLAIYRKAGPGDKVEMKTVHPKTGEPIDLCFVWRPGAQG